MGCVYSNQNSGSGGGSSKRKKNQNSSPSNGAAAGVELNPAGSSASDPNSPNASQHGSSNRHRIFDVEVCNVDKEGTIHGQLEITDTNLIYRLKGRSPIIWPLRFLRSYGHDKDIFSFECGRRCPTGEGVYVFRCTRAETLFKTLLEVINSATVLNASNGAINVSNPGPLVHHSSLTTPGGNSAHEYQNLAPFEAAATAGDPHANFGTLPSRFTTNPAATAAAGSPSEPRSHSSMGTASASLEAHTYLNSSSFTHHPNHSHSHSHNSHPHSHSHHTQNHQHLIRGDSGGGKSTTPNYYSTSTNTAAPTSMVSSASCQNCSTAGAFFSQVSVGSAGSRGSLNGAGIGTGGHGTLGGRRSSASTHSAGNSGAGGRDCFDSSTLPPTSRTPAAVASQQSSRGLGSLTLQFDRKNSEQHLYENHEVPLSSSSTAAAAAASSSTLPTSSSLTSRLRKLEKVSSNMNALEDQNTFCYVNLDGRGGSGGGGEADTISTAAAANASRRQHFFADKFGQSSGVGNPLYPHPTSSHSYHHHLHMAAASSGNSSAKSKSARTTPEPRLSYIQLDLNSKAESSSHSSAAASTTAAAAAAAAAASKSAKSESLKRPTAATSDRSAVTAERKLSSLPISSSSSATFGKSSLLNGAPNSNGGGASALKAAQAARKGSGGSLASSQLAMLVPPPSVSSSVASASSAAATASTDQLREVSLVNGDGSFAAAAAAIPAASVPYAQIDFAKTLALSNSAATHRKV